MENTPPSKARKIQNKVSLRVIKAKDNQTVQPRSTPVAPSVHSFHETDYEEIIAKSVRELNSQSESDIFSLYSRFVKNLIDNRQYQNSILDQLKFQEPIENHKTMSIRSFIQDKSSNGIQITSLQDFNNFMYKKRISIQVIKSTLSLDSLGSIQSDSDTTFQSESLVLTKELVSQFFETPSPFIMIESLCLLLKYLWRTKTVLTKQNTVKTMMIAIMLSFKLCYDQEVEGIGWYYASITNLDSKEIPKLQGKFLRQLQFQTDVTKQQYFTVSTYLLGKGQK